MRKQFVEQHPETVMVWNYRNADCSLTKNFITSFIIIFRTLSFPIAITRMSYRHLLIEGALFAVGDREVRTGGWEEWKERGRRQRRNFRESVGADDVHDGDVGAGVDDHAREVEEAVLDRPAEDQRRNVLAVGTEGDVVGGLVVRRGGRSAAHRDRRLVDEVVETDHVAAVGARVVAESHATRPVAGVERNEQPHCRVLKQRLQHRAPVITHTRTHAHTHTHTHTCQHRAPVHYDKSSHLHAT